MAISEQDVRAILEQDEPDYVEAAKMGAEALPYLEVLVEDEDPAIASKAASLAGFIADPGSVQVLIKASASEEPVVRVAAAGAARQLAEEAASEVLLPLVEDEDAGVQKFALKSVPEKASTELKAKVESLEQQPELPAATRELLSEMKGEKAAEFGPHVPELSPMPAPEGSQLGYDEALSADETPGGMMGMEDLSVPAAVEQEMPGSQDESLSASAIEQEMPGFNDSAMGGDMGSDEQEMPGAQ